MKRFFILIMAVILSAISCTTTRYISSQPSMEAEWTGRTHADIVRHFGAPTREVSDGADGLILVYEEVTTVHETSTSGSTITTETKENRKFKEFSLGADGKCYGVRTNEKIADGIEPYPWGTGMLIGGGILVTAWLVGLIACGH